LKPIQEIFFQIVRVAPRAGAWIETVGVKDADAGGEVAPRAGAWIETLWRLRW